MENLYKEVLNTRIVDDYDVIVCGSGPSGIAASISASRNGVKTLLIEQQSSLGGMSTSGMMSHWTGTCDSKFYREVLTRCSSDYSPVYRTNEKRRYIDSEKLKFVYQEMAMEANLDVLYYSFICGVEMDGNVLKGIFVENKSGRTLYRAKVIIDCTGDGDVAYKAGVPFINGREDGKKQPATLMFKVGGVDKKRAILLGSFESTYETEKGELQTLAKINLPEPAGYVLVYDNPLDGVITINMTNCTNIDGCKTEDLTKAEFVCRSQMYAIRDFLRNYVPGFENCYILTSASFMGIRETRHFKGLYTITREDIESAKNFDDWVVKGALFNFDVHGLDKPGLDPTGVQSEFKQSNGYQIPFGCFIPVNVEGLLLAGRCISGTHIAHSNYRAMPICMGMGEAMGICASIAIKENIMPSKVDVKKIQSLVD